MYHSLRNEFLYSAYKIEAHYKDTSGKELSGAGTCFFVRNKQNEICLVTNRHVIDLDFKQPTPKYKDFKLSKVIIEGKKTNPTNLLPDHPHLFEIVPTNYFFSVDINNDLVVFKNIQVVAPNDAVINYIISYDLIATKEKIETGIKVGDFVSFPGFPEWHDKKENRPILRSGTISSDPRYNYSDNKTVFGDCIAYEAFSTGGSSGSPVFALQRGFLGGDIVWPDARELLLVGINAGHLRTEKEGYHAGISYLYKSQCLLELIN
ncbi:MAG: serine protease [Bacteroidota bacterium]